MATTAVLNNHIMTGLGRVVALTPPKSINGATTGIIATVDYRKLSKYQQTLLLETMRLARSGEEDAPINVTTALRLNGSYASNGPVNLSELLSGPSNWIRPNTSKIIRD